MIASLRGTVISLGLDHAVIECAGVGYRVEATPAIGRRRNCRLLRRFRFLAVLGIDRSGSGADVAE